MTALLFKNWGFPHKVFKGVQTFESKNIKDTLQIQRFSPFLILPQTGIIPVLNERRELKGALTKSILLSTLSKRYKKEQEG